MHPLLSAVEMGEADRYTVQSLGLPEVILMEHAALAVVRRLRSRFRGLLNGTRGVLVAGTGNNGGDAMAAARILRQQGCRNVTLVLIGDEEKLTPSARLQYRALLKLGIPTTSALDESLLEACDWIVDGLFGTGLKRPVEGEARQVIESINRFAHRRWVLSIDIPSGLNPNTGNPLGLAVHACETVALGYLKKGLVTGQGADYVGRLHLRFIQIPRAIPGLRPDALLYGREDAHHLPLRRESGHKGDYGHCYFFAGETETQGAALLSCLAAFRSGAGLVTLVGPRGEPVDVRSRIPIEIMTAAWGPDLKARLKEGAALGIGPGFGTSDAKWALLVDALATPWPIVLDADALTLLANHRAEATGLLKRRRAVTVLTPHPKEASRLLDTSTEAIQADRYEACRRIQQTWGACVVLNGRGTIIACPERPLIVVTAGDAGLSKGGTGDLLTGVLTSLLAQGMKPTRALPLGTYLHGRASEIFTQKAGHTRSALAGEIAAQLTRALAELNPRP
jgi:ADP-dependent NAD(P)H-hydrate dehydratase / NAD(P)H-hydrate epimerase